MSGKKFLQFLKGAFKPMDGKKKEETPGDGEDLPPLPPLTAEVVIESVEQELKTDPPDGAAKAEEEGKKGEDEEKGEGMGSEQQFLTVRARLTEASKTALSSQEPPTHLVVVVDTSTSMNGDPWRQVQEGLLEIMENSLPRQHITLDVVRYDDNAKQVHFTPENYQRVVRDLRPGGMTGFIQAFKVVSRVIQDRRGTRNFHRVIVIFMTDGAETVDPTPKVKTEMERWHSTLRAMDTEVVIHCVGFSRDHDYNFLKNLCLDGMFRYCEPSDGPDALTAKMSELYQFILGTMTRVRVSISANERCQFLTGQGLQSSVELQGEMKEEPAGEGLVVSAESWVRVTSGDEPEFKVFIQGTVQQEDGEDQKVNIPCEVKVSRKILEGPVEKALWAMRIVDYFATMLTTRLTTAIEEKKDASRLKGRLDTLQRQLTNIPIMGPSIPKEERTRLLVTHDDIQSKIDILHKMLASYARGETSSVSMLARMHDLRYDAQFSKARRQRMMDRRAMGNISGAYRDQERLDQSFVDEKELKQLSQEALQFFFCALAQSSIKDVLMDSSDRENCMGFGLAVRRPEYVMDEPSKIILQVISGTLVCRTSMLDAIEHKISVDGQLGAHAGFSFNMPLGVATVGTSREPINAWLPLYVCATHWYRVRHLLRPSLGYFCTLDPLGYSPRQNDIMFIVLGQMLGRLTSENVGQHQLRLVFAFQRTCAAMMRDLYMEKNMELAISEFLNAPLGRTKDRVPSLFTLIGYLASLPTTVTRRLLGYDDGGDKSIRRKFWLAYLMEVLRRSSGAVYKDKNDKEMYGLLNALINGTVEQEEGEGSKTEEEGSKTEESSTKTAAEAAPSQSLASVGAVPGPRTGTVIVGPPPFDPVGEAKVPDLPLSHSNKMDKAMERWAESKYSDHPPKNQDKLKEAKKEIKRWLAELVTHLGVRPLEMPDAATVERKIQPHEQQEEEEEEGEEEKKKKKEEEEAEQMEEEESLDFNPYSLSPSILQFMAQMLRVLTPHCEPSPQAIPPFMAFLDWWLSGAFNIEELDAHSGLAPDSWVEAVKEAVRGMEQEVSAFEVSCHEEAEEEARVVSGQAADTETSEETAMEVVTEEQPETSMETDLTDTDAAARQKAAALEGSSPAAPTGASAAPTAAAGGAGGGGAGAGGGGGGGGGDDGGGGGDNNDNQDDEDSFIEDDSDGFEDDDDAMDFFDMDFPVAPAYQLPKTDTTADDQFKAFLAALHLLGQQQEEEGAAGGEASGGGGGGGSGEERMLALLRAALCQTVQYRTNALARNAIMEDKFKDLVVRDNVVALLRSLYKDILLKRTGASAVKASRSFWALMSHRMQKAENMWTFIGYLNHSFTGRSEGYKVLFSDLINAPDPQKIPLLKEKLHCLLTASYQGKPIFAKGNVYYPEQSVIKKICRVIGEEEWTKIQLDLRAGLKIHVYRDSDIPNRHGYCNSNPYIPNELRQELGMTTVPGAWHTRRPGQHRRRKRRR